MPSLSYLLKYDLDVLMMASDCSICTYDFWIFYICESKIHYTLNQSILNIEITQIWFFSWTYAMELFSRRRWRVVSAQLSNKFGYALYTLPLLFCKFLNKTACHWGQYEPSSPVSCHAPNDFVTQDMMHDNCSSY